MIVIAKRTEYRFFAFLEKGFEAVCVETSGVLFHDDYFPDYNVCEPLGLVAL